MNNKTVFTIAIKSFILYLTRKPDSILYNYVNARNGNNIHTFGPLMFDPPSNVCLSLWNKTKQN